MDIKSTKYKKIFNRIDVKISKTYFTVLVNLIMVCLTAFTMYSYYGVELQLAKIKRSNPFDSLMYANSLFDSNYYLNYKASQNENNRIQRPADFYLSKSTIDKLVENVDVDYYSAKLEEEDIKNSFDESFKSVSDYILGSEGQQKYLTINTKTGHRISNYNFDNYIIDKILEYKDKRSNMNTHQRREVSKSISDHLSEKYRNYVVLEYDDKGNYKTLYTYGINEASFNNYFLQLESRKKLDEVYIVDPDHYEGFGDYRIDPIKNRIFVYALPNNLDISFYEPENSISYIMYDTERGVYDDFVSFQEKICLAIIIITLLIPTSQLKKYWGIFTGLKLPLFVILSVATIIYFTFIDSVPKVYMLRETINGSILRGIMQSRIDPTWYRNIVNFINIVFWFCSYTFVFCYVVIFKRFVEYGPKKYIENNSVIYYILSRYFARVKAFINSVVLFDMSKKYNRLWIIGIVIVFAGATVLSVTKYTEPLPWVMSILIFLILMLSYIKVVSRQIKDVVEDYSKLLELTESIAKGDLDKDIESENIGVYNEIKLQLVSIKEAYKKSVQEEIRSQQMKSELISNVSHDLKTPLTSIITYSDLLMNMDTSGDARKYIETINRKSERLKILIDDMFEISKAQTGNIKLNLNYINVVELMKQTVGELEDILANRNIKLMTKYPKYKVILELDGEKTYRVFENLLVNMSKYAMPNTRAYVEIRDEGDEVLISFKNISENFIDFREDEIIERFIRGDRSRNTEGSGLGLSITKSYVELQKGAIEIVLDADLFKVNIRFKKTIDDLNNKK
ncbi:sensor histidine kinase [Peptostreptococcus anaerobius]|uniref:sensor histidine kinase n=1 Tax=Peptostreptococcus anaerobius TaxID=1261 RepID=UPI003564956C